MSKLPDRKVEGLRFEEVIPRLSEAIEKAGGAAAVARSSGISASSISGYLNEGIEPKFMKMAFLARACSVSLDWLAYGYQPDLSVRAGNDESELSVNSKFLAHHASKPANFRALVMLLLAAQETSRKTGESSTVADVLNYMEPLYEIFSAMKDGSIRLKPFDDLGDGNDR